jgi:hypothetical protein
MAAPGDTEGAFADVLAALNATPTNPPAPMNATAVIPEPTSVVSTS